jgi:hypothetical protein
MPPAAPRVGALLVYAKRRRTPDIGATRPRPAPGSGLVQQARATGARRAMMTGPLARSQAVHVWTRRRRLASCSDDAVERRDFAARVNHASHRCGATIREGESRGYPSVDTMEVIRRLQRCVCKSGTQPCPETEPLDQCPNSSRYFDFIPWDKWQLDLNQGHHRS